MAIDVVFRNEKGDELTWEEMDGNLANLKVAIETKKDAFSILPVAQGGTGVATIAEAKQVLEVPEFANQIEYMPEGVGAVATSVQDQLRSLELPDYSALRSFNGNMEHVRIVKAGITGEFIYDSSDMTSADNGGTVIVDSSNRRWKREYSGPVFASWFEPDETGSTSCTAKIASAISVVSTTGGEVKLGRGTFKANISIPEGVTVSGESSANLFSSDPKGTKVVADSNSLPAVKINNGSTPIQGACLRYVCIDASGSNVGLYIAGASYINVDTVSVINGADTNILIECLASNPTFFVFLKSVTTYNATNYNFKVMEDISLGGTFTTSIFANNMVSYTQPGKTTEGRIAYIQGQVIANGYWEDTGTNLIVIDKSTSLDTALVGNGLTIDGATGSSAVKIITSPTWSSTKAITLNAYYVPTSANGFYYKCTTAGATGSSEPTWPTTIGGTVSDGSVVWTCSTYSGRRINGYIYGQLTVDGNVTNASDGNVTTGPIGHLQPDYYQPGITRATYIAPCIIGTDVALQYSWYDATAKAMRKSTSLPSSSSGGNVIVGAEAGFVAAPASGTWTKGDVVFNAGAARGLVIGWICTVAGSPGTWESFGSAGAVENVGALPTADSTQRGRMVTVLAGAGTADKLYICLRSAASTYSWVQVAIG